MTYTSRFVGLDISKSSLDVCLLPDAERASFPNTAEGCASLVTYLTSFAAIERVILEPTGGYERLAVAALQAAGRPVAKVNARQVRQFARACGQLSKTDSIDAFVLADYGRRMRTRILPERSGPLVLLAQFVLRYRQLSHMIVQEKNRRDKLTGGEADTRSRDWIEETLRFLCDQRQAVVDKMAACIEADADLAGKAEVLMSLKGVGLRTACFLLADLPELGLIEKGQIAKLVGVAPLNRDSGLMRGKRMIAGGRRPIRDALYVAALSAIRFEPALRAFNTNLRNRGKPGKLAIVAVIRKIVVILNARMRDHLTKTLAA